MAGTVKKSTGRKGAAGSQKAAKNASGGAGKRTGATERRDERSSISDEIIIIITLLFSVLLVLSYFNLCGAFGTILNTIIFGLMGSLGYVFPAVLFFIVAFCMANKGNRLAVRKIIYGIMLLLFTSAIVQMAVGGFNKDIGVFDYFTNSLPDYEGVNATYGGLFGGLICKLLCPFVGDVAAVCIMVAFTLVFIILITGKAIFTYLTKSGVGYARERRMKRAANNAGAYDDYAEEESHTVRDVSGNDTKQNSSRQRRIVERQVTVNEKAVSKKKTDYVPDESIDEDILSGMVSDEPDSFIGNLMKRGMGVGHEKITETKPCKEVRETFGEAAFDVGEIDAGIEAAKGDASDTADIGTNAEEIARAELIKKFGGKNTASHQMREVRINGVTQTMPRTLFIDEEENAGVSEMTPDSVNTGMHSESIDVQEAADENIENRTPEINTAEINTVETVIKAEPEVSGLQAANIYREPETSVSKTVSAEAESQVREEAAAMPEQRASSGAVCFTDMSVIPEVKKPVMPEYEFPPIELLKKSETQDSGNNQQELQEIIDKLQRTFESFGVGVTVTDASCGPTVTRYELLPDQGVKVKTITALADDIKLALAAPEIRIEAPIPGKAAVGIEVPNKKNVPVLLRDLIDTDEFRKCKSNLAFAVGKDISGGTIVSDIASMPHMLIAGATGSGKSVCINSLIMSIIYKAKPSDVKLIMIDPKRVELTGYNGIPHLLVPVVTDVKKANGALNWAIAEMDDRYRRFADNNVNNLASYNTLMEERFYEEGNEGECPDKLPQIVLIVDELNDLMMTANSKEVEAAICRLTQLARASGIHVVLATQRPSVNVITGTIKANIPTRIAFSVSSIVDSRTIIDQAGAEKLLGKGDMLFFPSGYPKPVRLQGAFVSDREVAATVEFIKNQYKNVKYNEKIANHINSAVSPDPQVTEEAKNVNSDRDEFFEEAGKFIIEKQKASIGMLQRVYRIGFNRAARIMDQLSEAGVVGPEEGTKPRKILMSAAEFIAYCTGETIAATEDTADDTEGESAVDIYEENSGMQE